VSWPARRELSRGQGRGLHRPAAQVALVWTPGVEVRNSTPAGKRRHVDGDGRGGRLPSVSPWWLAPDRCPPAVVLACPAARVSPRAVQTFIGYEVSADAVSNPATAPEGLRFGGTLGAMMRPIFI